MYVLEIWNLGDRNTSTHITAVGIKEELEKAAVGEATNAGFPGDGSGKKTEEAFTRRQNSISNIKYRSTVANGLRGSNQMDSWDLRYSRHVHELAACDALNTRIVQSFYLHNLPVTTMHSPRASYSSKDNHTLPSPPSGTKHTPTSDLPE